MKLSRSGITKVQAVVLIAVIVAAAVGAAYYFASQPPPAPQELKIGAVFPLSGRLASIGRDIKVAIELAVDIINNKFDLDLPLARTEGLSNLGGAKIRVIFADSRGEPAAGQSETERLITQEKVVAVTGAWQSAVTKPASEAAERLGIPFLNGASSSPALTERGLKWFFRTSPHDITFSEAMLRFAKEVSDKKGLNLKTVMIVSVDDEFGVNAVKAEERFAKENGFDIVETILYSTRIVDASSEALRVKSRNPDILIQNSFTADAILFMKEYKKLNWFPKLFLVQDAGFESVEFFQTMASDGDFIITRSAWAGLDNKLPIVKKVNELYKARHPEAADMDGQSSREFTAILVLADAINRARSTDPEKIRKALAETDWSADQLLTGWRGVKFDAMGQNMKATPALLQRLKGSWRTIWPFEIAPVEPVVPSPNWNQR